MTLHEYQVKTHMCKQDKICFTCGKVICELCSTVHVFRTDKDFINDTPTFDDTCQVCSNK